MSSAYSITAAVKPPRAVYLDFPHGRTAGKPHDLPLQRRLLRDTLDRARHHRHPGDDPPAAVPVGRGRCLEGRRDAPATRRVERGRPHRAPSRPAVPVRGGPDRGRSRVRARGVPELRVSSNDGPARDRHRAPRPRDAFAGRVGGTNPMPKVSDRVEAEARPAISSVAAAQPNMTCTPGERTMRYEMQYERSRTRLVVAGKALAVVLAIATAGRGAGRGNPPHYRRDAGRRPDLHLPPAGPVPHPRPAVEPGHLGLSHHSRPLRGPAEPGRERRSRARGGHGVRGFRRQHHLHVHPAAGREMVERRPGDRARLRLRLAARRRSRDRVALRLVPGAHRDGEREGDPGREQATLGAGGAGGRRPHAGGEAEHAAALLPGDDHLRHPVSPRTGRPSRRTARTGPRPATWSRTAPTRSRRWC